jgi:hypothetical protein
VKREQEICDVCEKKRPVKHYKLGGKDVRLCKSCDFINALQKAS